VQAQLLMHEDVVPVCSPRLLESAAPRGRGRAHQPVAAEALAELPLLQQSTRPYGWRQWFDAMGVDAPHALDGPRYELFSMLAVAATHGMGVALMPPLLIEAELASGELVVACNRPLRGERAYYLISPAQAQPPVLTTFAQWLQTMAQTATSAAGQAGGGG
jgi:DNA-binding transcriptional LysR family regulator